MLTPILMRIGLQTSSSLAAILLLPGLGIGWVCLVGAAFGELVAFLLELLSKNDDDPQS